MALTLQPVPVQHTAQTWPLVEEMLDRAVKHGHDDYTLEQVRLYVNTGQWSLLVVTDRFNAIHGAMVVSYVNQPNARVAFVICAGGSGFFNKDIVDQLKVIAVGAGATKIQAGTRESVARLLARAGFVQRSVLLEIDMGAKPWEA